MQPTDRRPDDQAALEHMQPATPHDVWLLMSDLVLDHQRRRAVAEALGMSFNRARAIRRLARQPMTMGQFAAALDVDPPNATGVVDDLEAQGLVRRRPHPTDRRTKIRRADPRGRKGRPPSRRDPRRTAPRDRRARPRGPQRAPTNSHGHHKHDLTAHFRTACRSGIACGMWWGTCLRVPARRARAHDGRLAWSTSWL